MRTKSDNESFLDNLDLGMTELETTAAPARCGGTVPEDWCDAAIGAAFTLSIAGSIAFT